AEGRVLGGDLLDDAAGRGRDVEPRALARGRRAAAPSAEADAARQLALEERHLALRARGAGADGEPTRVVDLLAQRDDAPCVRPPRSGIEQLAGVGAVVGRRGVGRGLAAGGDVEGMELASRMTQERREIVQALRVFQTDRAIAEAERPVVALALQA